MDMSKSDEEGKAQGPHVRPLPPSRDVPAIVGRNLKALRKTQGYSLEGLAEVSGVSRAMLGQIETGKSVPTVGLLWKIADALGVPVTTLIATENGTTTVVMRKASALDSGASAFFRRPLFPVDRFRGVEFYELRVGPGHVETVEPHHAPGARESLVVAHGTLRITIGEAAAVLIAEGDAILAEADVVRSYHNPGDVEAVAYLVVIHGGRPAA